MHFCNYISDKMYEWSIIMEKAYKIISFIKKNGFVLHSVTVILYLWFQSALPTKTRPTKLFENFTDQSIETFTEHTIETFTEYNYSSLWKRKLMSRVLIILISHNLILSWKATPIFTPSLLCEGMSTSVQR